MSVCHFLCLLLSMIVSNVGLSGPWLHLPISLRRHSVRASRPCATRNNNATAVKRKTTHKPTMKTKNKFLAINPIHFDSVACGHQRVARRRFYFSVCLTISSPPPNCTCFCYYPKEHRSKKSSKISILAKCFPSPSSQLAVYFFSVVCLRDVQMLIPSHHETCADQSDTRTHSSSAAVFVLCCLQELNVNINKP